MIIWEKRDLHLLSVRWEGNVLKDPEFLYYMVLCLIQQVPLVNGLADAYESQCSDSHQTENNHEKKLPFSFMLELPWRQSGIDRQDDQII